MLQETLTSFSRFLSQSILVVLSTTFKNSRFAVKQSCPTRGPRGCLKFKWPAM